MRQHTALCGYHLLTLLFCLLLVGCDDYIDYNPNEIEASPRELTAYNLSRLEALSVPGFAPFKFAVLADTHAYYDELEAAIGLINLDPQIAFVLVAGDLTDYGYLQEYHWSTELLQKLHPPYLTVIGNHDALNHGKQNYLNTFGPYDYSFQFNNVHFVQLNSNTWEFDNAVPDLPWLALQLQDAHLYRHTIVMAHIGPYDSDRFANELGQRYRAILELGGVSMVVSGHGHTHHYSTQLLSDGTTLHYLINGTVKYRQFTLVSVEADALQIERVFY